MTKLRVLVVDDSITVRKRLCEVLAENPDVEVVAEAEDGRQAIDLCMTQRPDVITMDMMLPVMSGLAATEYIMAHRPTPILIVSSSFNRGEVFKTYDALSAGAVDVIEKPNGSEPVGEWERAFLAALKIVARVRVITHPRARLAGASLPVHPPVRTHSAGRLPFELVVIGASTGGPSAIVEILKALPPEFAMPILVVMHIAAPFAAPFADWLQAQTGRRVAYAEDGESLTSLAASVRVAPPDRHLLVRDGRLRLTRDPERHSCRPSVDVLFESAARECGKITVGCLLTGMGRDGAAGLLDLRRAGAVTIAQSEETCVVYGMPREAALRGAAEQILPLAEIGPTLASLVPPEKKVRS